MLRLWQCATHTAENEQEPTMAPLTGNLPPNPFDHAFEMLGHVPEITTESVNAEALEALTQALTTRAADRGRMILLRSPRAGFGKTHLLMRLHQRVAHTHEFIPLEPSKGRFLDAQSVLDSVLRRFSRVLPGGGGLTVLDLLARRILATGLEPLVRSGDVPSQDRDSALQALRQRPVETFDFHNEEAVTARWAMANFSLLGPRLTAELAERTHAGYRPVAWWVELLFRYSSASVEQTSRNSSLFETVFGGNVVETDMHEKLVALLNLTGLVTSPVLVLDEVEGFSSNPDAALQVTTFLNALHQSCRKLALIVSVNGDVWETAFLPRLPCGLKDRLCDIVVDLKPMERNVAESLLRDRAGGYAEAILEGMDFDTGVAYARGLIREASESWQNIVSAEQEGSSGPDNESGGVQEPISLLAPELTAVGRQKESADGGGGYVADSPSEEIEEIEEFHAPAAVVMPGGEQPPAFTGGATEEGTGGNAWEGDTAESVFSSESEPLFEELEPALHPPLPDDLPQPFAQQQAASEYAAPPEGQAPPEEYASPEEYTPLEGYRPAEGDAHRQAFAPPASRSVQDESGASPFAMAGESAPVFAPDTESPPVGGTPNVVSSPFSIDTTAAAENSPFAPLPPQPPGNQPGEPAQSQPVDSPFRMEDGETPAHEPPAQPPAHEVTEHDHEKVEDLLKQFRDRYGRG